MNSATTPAPKGLHATIRKPRGIGGGPNTVTWPKPFSPTLKLEAVRLPKGGRKPTSTNWISDGLPMTIGYLKVFRMDADDRPTSLSNPTAFLLLSEGYLISSVN
jgi:hypothetical protein